MFSQEGVREHSQESQPNQYWRHVHYIKEELAKANRREWSFEFRLWHGDDSWFCFALFFHFWALSLTLLSFFHQDRADRYATAPLYIVLLNFLYLNPWSFVFPFAPVLLRGQWWEQLSGALLPSESNPQQDCTWPLCKFYMLTISFFFFRFTYFMENLWNLLSLLGHYNWNIPVAFFGCTFACKHMLFE